METTRRQTSNTGYVTKPMALVSHPELSGTA